MRNQFYFKRSDVIRRGEPMPISSIEGKRISTVDILFIEGGPHFY